MICSPFSLLDTYYQAGSTSGWVCSTVPRCPISARPFVFHSLQHYLCVFVTQPSSYHLWPSYAPLHVSDLSTSEGSTYQVETRFQICYATLSTWAYYRFGWTGPITCQQHPWECFLPLLCSRASFAWARRPQSRPPRISETAYWRNAWQRQSCRLSRSWCPDFRLARQVSANFPRYLDSPASGRLATEPWNFLIVDALKFA